MATTDPNRKEIECSCWIARGCLWSSVLSFLVLVPVCPQFTLSPSAHKRWTLHRKSFCDCHIFTVQPQSQQIRAAEGFRLAETEGSLSCVSHREVVFQTQDYAHCDLPKRAVLAIFSRSRMKATLKRRTRLMRLCQGKKAQYLGARDLRFNYGSILNEISFAVKNPRL